MPSKMDAEIVIGVADGFCRFQRTTADKHGKSAQAGESQIREVVMSAAFGRSRRAAQTPFNIVYEARP